MSIQRVALIFDDQTRPETTGVYCLRALRSLVSVAHFRPTDLARIPRQGFDLYLNIDDGVRYRLPADLRPSAWWVINTHLNFERNCIKAVDFDVVNAAQRDGAEGLRRKGITTASWLPLACDPEIHGKQPVPKTHDLCFVGNQFGGPRDVLINLLQQHYPGMFVGHCYFEDMARTYSATRIIFNRSIINDINMRVFEALASGSMLLTNDLRENGQAELFWPDKHLVTYAEPGELLEKAVYYLQHEDARERIAAAGRTEVLARHTYRHRLERLLLNAEAVLSRTVVSAGSKNPGQGKEGKPSVLPPKVAATFNSQEAESVAAGYFEFARPELLNLVPRSARRVLDIGCGAGRFGEALKARQQAEVIGIEYNEAAGLAARERLNNVFIGDVEHMDLPLQAGSLDTVMCGDILEHLRQPDRLLRRVRDWLRPEGLLIASIPNVRHHSVLRMLLAGDWTYEPAGLLDRTHLRFFTRQAISQLLESTGFRLQSLSFVPGPGYEEWQRAGNPEEFRIAGLAIRGLPPGEAEDFFIYQFLVVASPLLGTHPENRSQHGVALAAPPRVEDRPGFSSELLGLVPLTARRVLDIDCGRGELGAQLKARQSAYVLGMVLDKGQEQSARAVLDEVVVCEEDGITAVLPDGPFDSILCVDVLFQVRNPGRLLHMLRQRLAPTGRLIAGFANMRHHSVVSALMRGTWTWEPSGELFDRRHIRFYTRREVEKLFYRASLQVQELRPLTGTGHATSDLEGKQSAVQFGNLSMNGLTDSGEFAIRGYLLSACPTVMPDHGLTSIVILTHNQLAYTRLCLDSLREHTPEAYELVIVDNASTDGTVEYLSTLAGTRVITNSENLGFPAAANQGMRAASGQQILLLNNDTIATTGWLGRLLAALHSDPTIGLVGPCSNYVSGEQQRAVSYDSDLARLDGFAWEFGKAHDQERVDTDRLVGFCLLIARSVLDKVGFLDERFGIGCFEDDDYTRRVVQAGYRALIACDSFVHHFGSRTFVASGIDYARLFQVNRQLYLRKWQTEESP